MASAPDPNPHLADYVPGSWDPPFRKWFMGALLPLAIALPGISAAFGARASIPLPTRGRPGLIWFDAEGLTAITWGATLLGLALTLHGRFFWRYRKVGWQRYATVQNTGALIAAVGLALTFVQIVVELFR